MESAIRELRISGDVKDLKYPCRPEANKLDNPAVVVQFGITD